MAEMRLIAQAALELRASVLELGRRTLVGTIGVQFAILMCGTLTGLLAARMLGPSGRGELTAVIVWPSALSALLTLGMNQALVYRSGKNPTRAAIIFGTSLRIGILQALLTLLIGTVLVYFTARHLGAAAYHSSLIYLSGIPFFIVGGYPVNIFQGLGKLKAFNWLRFLPVGLYAAALVFLFTAQLGSVRSIILVQVAAFIVAAGIGLLALRRAVPPPFRFERDELRGISRFALRAYAANCTGFLNQRVDQLILSLLVPTAQLGYYVVAVTLSTGLIFLPTALASIALSRATQQHEISAAALVRRSLLLTAVVFSAVCLVFYLVLPWLLVLLFGRAFAPSVTAACILIPGIFMLGMAQVLYSGANALGRPEVPSYGEGAGLVITAIGLFLAVPRYGYIGAAWVSTSAYTLSLLVSTALLWRNIFIKAQEPQKMAAQV
jgi:O-antigen/teichoic acid export membrane protein